MHKDIQSGLVVTAVALLYLWGLRGISETTLSDEVGPTGIPYLLGLGLAATGLLIAARGALMARKAQPAVLAAPAADDDDEADAPAWRAMSFLGLGVVFIGAAWLAGYVAAGIVLLAATATFEGIRPSARLAALAVGGAVGFWIIFVKLLGIDLPHGVLFGG
jgi:hypothetical protein